jgi:hypothetical protein
MALAMSDNITYIEGRDTRVRAMATVQITLPDDLARDLATSGLLEPQTLETILRDRLKATRIVDFSTLRTAIRANPAAPITNEEINAEIEAYRTEQRRETGRRPPTGPGSAAATPPHKPPGWKSAPEPHPGLPNDRRPPGKVRVSAAHPTPPTARESRATA